MKRLVPSLSATVVLDVYKRQVLLYYIILQVVELRVLILVDNLLVRERSLGPVSYTHLDVYKRQYYYYVMYLFMSVEEICCY